MEKSLIYVPKYCLFAKCGEQYFDKETGKKKMRLFKASRVEFDLMKSQGRDIFRFDCGKCVYCMKKYSIQWAVRCVLESQLHLENCFITLTYNELNLPIDGNLVKRDYQLFLKRLRKKYKEKKIRYFLAGEYGSQGYRPHFHIILFGYKPNDLLFFKKDGNSNLYVSQEVSDLWGKGFISVGTDMSVSAVKYTSKYLSKLQVLPENINVKPFIQASTNPGIGAWAYDKSMLVDNAIFINGTKYGVPRYFKKMAEKYNHLKELDINKIKVENGQVYKMLLEKDYFQELNNYFYYAKKSGYGYQHLYDLKNFDAYKYYKKVEKELVELNDIVYNNDVKGGD